MSGEADGWIRWTTTACVALLALIAGSVLAFIRTFWWSHTGSQAGSRR